MNNLAKVILITTFIFIAACTTQEQNDTQFDSPIENSETITIPVTAYIIKANHLTSNRDEQNLLALFEQVNNIWNQANMQIDIKEIKILNTEDSVISSALKGNHVQLINAAYNPNSINIYFASTIGANGIAMSNKIAFIADITTVNDFRATSHEIGHILGLRHVPNNAQLMARGVNGIILTESEIAITRNNANLLFNRDL